jgi:hypothetical protein
MHNQRYMCSNDRMITIKRDYKCHTCTRDIPSILYPDLRLYYVYNDHISIHNTFKVSGHFRAVSVVVL